MVKGAAHNGDVVLEVNKDVLQVPNTGRMIAINANFRMMPVVHTKLFRGERALVERLKFLPAFHFKIVLWTFEVSVNVITKNAL